MAEEDFSVEGRITDLKQTSRRLTGIETMICLESDPFKWSGKLLLTNISFPGPTGLRIGDYISTFGHRINNLDVLVGCAEKIQRLENKGIPVRLEVYEISKV